MPTETEAEQSIKHLDNLAAELGRRHFSARVVALHGRAPQLRVINLAAPVLAENILAVPASDGTWAFSFPWPHRIAAAADVFTAADRIERVLAEVGRPSPKVPYAHAGPAPALAEPPMTSAGSYLP
ncbi:hypothetical protein [Planotetraspora sp. GP83]|uniref:hypothetical protein n=1 Tax=Planotetraspora sp. GP83 TaxID=3156264 RepID=UPI0035113AA4